MPFAVLVKIVLENVDATKPVAILLSERAPSLDEAWEDAVRDGIISSFEGRSLLDCNTFGLHRRAGGHHRSTFIRARAVRRGRQPSTAGFPDRGLPLIDGEWTVVAGLKPGKVPKEHRQLMTNLLHCLH